MQTAEELEKLRVDLVNKYINHKKEMSEKKAKKQKSKEDSDDSDTCINAVIKKEEEKQKKKKKTPEKKKKAPCKKEVLVDLVYYGMIDKGKEVSRKVIAKYGKDTLIQLCDGLKYDIYDPETLLTLTEAIQKRSDKTEEKKDESTAVAKEDSESDDDPPKESTPVTTPQTNGKHPVEKEEDDPIDVPVIVDGRGSDIVRIELNDKGTIHNINLRICFKDEEDE